MKKLLACLLLTTGIFCANAQDWANFGKYAKANAEIGTPPLAVFMGDSITEGWVGQRKVFFDENNFAGRGISGQVTSQMLVRFRADVIALKPKYVVILAGTNDIARNQGVISVENIFGNIVSMCEIAKANKIKPVICSVLPAHEYKWRKEIESVAPIKELNEMLKAYAKKNKIAYADFYSALVDERYGLPEKYSPDGVHPNAECLKIMEPIVLSAIKAAK
jgi:lysophospholipase L1-like esterase